MRLQEWQSNQSLVDYSRDLLKDPRFQGLLSMIEEEHAKNYRPASGVELAAHTHVLMLGEVYGYDSCLENLRASARFVPVQQPLQSKFEPPDPATQI